MDYLQEVIKANQETLKKSEQIILMSEQLIQSEKQKVAWRTYAILLTLFNLLFFILIIFAV